MGGEGGVEAVGELEDDGVGRERVVEILEGGADVGEGLQREGETEEVLVGRGRGRFGVEVEGQG